MKNPVDKLTAAAEKYTAALGSKDCNKALDRLKRAARDYANSLRVQGNEVVNVNTEPYTSHFVRWCERVHIEYRTEMAGYAVLIATDQVSLQIGSLGPYTGSITYREGMKWKVLMFRSVKEYHQAMKIAVGLQYI